jgi:DNA-binding response OmpR family regulator
MAQRPRVLLADDDGLAAHAVEHAIRSWGYDVVAVVGTGSQAMSVARREPVDVAVLDAAMPDVDGLAAARDLVGNLGVPVILLSGDRRMPLLVQALELDVACLPKPVRTLELKAALLWALGGERGRARPARVGTGEPVEEVEM